MKFIITIILATLIIVIITPLLRYFLYRRRPSPSRFLSRILRGTKAKLILSLFFVALSMYVIVALIKRLFLPKPINPFAFLSKIFYRDPIKLVNQATGFVTGYAQAGYENIANTYHKLKTALGH